MDKIVLETENKKLTFTSNNNVLSIDFFSVEDDNEFIISSNNAEIYNVFKNVFNSIDEQNEVYIYDEENLRNSLVFIQLLDDEIKLVFSSSYYTTIGLKSDEETIHSVFLNKLYNSFKELDKVYYQTYVDEKLNEGKEFRFEISG